MKQLAIRNVAGLSAAGDEINIIHRREILPLLAKARQVLRHYEKAMGCSTAVLDRSGKDITRSRICFGSECQCGKIHYDAIGESRRTESTYVYSCGAGFVFWTSPLYHNRRYTGSLVAGQVILRGHNMGLKKLNSLCENKGAAQKFSAMVEVAPEKSLEEIKAMAEMLGLCAEEISQRGEEPVKIIRRKVWQNESSKHFMESFKTIVKKKQPSRVESDLEYAARGNRLPMTRSPDSTPELPHDDSWSRMGLLEKERMLIAAFRRGDNETGGKLLKELMGRIVTARPGNMRILRFRAIELLALLSRAAITGGESRGAVVREDTFASDALLDTNNRYLNRILESNTVEELIDNLHHSADRMASKIFSFQGMRHASALRRAERYIWENYTHKLSLEEIAKASGLSAPYFSTIFKEEMGENLSSYLNRLRVERTITLLMETGKPLNEIAKLCGFEDQSWFSKIFKSFTGISPGKFRENGGGTLEFKSGEYQENGEIADWPLASG